MASRASLKDLGGRTFPAPRSFQLALRMSQDSYLCEMKRARRGALTTKDLSPLANTLEKLLKQLILHGYSFSTTNGRRLVPGFRAAEDSAV